MPPKKESPDKTSTASKPASAKKPAAAKKPQPEAPTGSSTSLKDAVPKTKTAGTKKTGNSKAAPESIAPSSVSMGILAEETLLQYESTPDAIAVRAYFLGEKRRASGAHPDPVRDWLEAEAEILAEMQAMNAKTTQTKRRRKSESGS